MVTLFHPKGQLEGTFEKTMGAGPDLPGDRSEQREEDRRLMARVAAGDTAAQDELALRVMGCVRRVSRSILRHPDDAEDATQNALVTILTSAGSYRAAASIERWAEGVTVYTALRIVRQRKRHLAAVDGDADPEALTSLEQNTPAPAGLSADLERSLDALPDVRRTTVLLRCAMGYSIEEVGELMGVSPNTVKDRLKQALAQVRVSLRHYLQTERS